MVNGKLSVDERVTEITRFAGVPDATRILRRVAALLESGEVAESIMRRLNPPARIPRIPTRWGEAYE